MLTVKNYRYLAARGHFEIVAAESDLIPNLSHLEHIEHCYKS